LNFCLSLAIFTISQDGVFCGMNVDGLGLQGFFGGMKVDGLGIGEIQNVQFGMLVPQAPTLGSDGMTAICDEEGGVLTLCERLS